jgi:hypothetical protein
MMANAEEYPLFQSRWSLITAHTRFVRCIRFIHRAGVRAARVSEKGREWRRDAEVKELLKQRLSMAAQGASRTHHRMVLTDGNVVTATWPATTRSLSASRIDPTSAMTA